MGIWEASESIAGRLETQEARTDFLSSVWMLKNLGNWWCKFRFTSEFTRKQRPRSLLEQHREWSLTAGLFALCGSCRFCSLLANWIRATHIGIIICLSAYISSQVWPGQRLTLWGPHGSSTLTHRINYQINVRSFVARGWSSCSVVRAAFSEDRVQFLAPK